MHIIADENIPYVREAFAAIGEVHTVHGRQLNAEHVRNADILLVRSVTPVNQQLLQNSPVRFVGTATIGVDHVDQVWLQQQGIGFASAPGCNANSAAEYVVSVLLILAQRHGFRLTEKTVGIIGCGNVGSRVYQKLTALGMHCLRHDPPLAARSNSHDFASLQEVLRADVVTVHVPLQTVGQYPTRGLVDASFLQQLSAKAIFINTSRGEVVNEAALQQQLAYAPKQIAVLDVWQNEPVINPDTVVYSSLATPHIAGYSFDGKVRGTEMLVEAVTQHFQLDYRWHAAEVIPPPPITDLHFSDSINDEQAIYQAVTCCYDPRSDDAALRRSLQDSHRAESFDHLRKYYPTRREFSTLRVTLPTHRHNLAAQLSGLGFQVITV